MLVLVLAGYPQRRGGPRPPDGTAGFASLELWSWMRNRWLWMSTERRPVPLLPLGRTVALVVSIFVAIVVSLLVLNNTRSEILSGVRAYVNGEGLYSKAQKDAVNYLVRYAHSHAESDYRKFHNALAVPIGDRVARLELEKRKPDMARVYQGFVAARNHPDDVDNMAKLFRRFRHVTYMARAIDIWSQGDALIMNLGHLGEELHAEIAAGGVEPQRIDAILGQVEELNEELTVLEDDFSRTLGEGNRWLERRSLQFTYAATALLLMAGVFLSWQILRQARAVEETQRSAERQAAARARQHEATARLGATALRGGDLQALMAEAADRVSSTLGTDFSEVLELVDRRELLLRTASGPRPGDAAETRLAVEESSASYSSQAAYTLAATAPVIVPDLRAETRFSDARLLRERGVTSGISALIAGDSERPYGVIASYATSPRTFTEDEASFLDTVANVLAMAIQRQRADRALQEAGRQKDQFLAMLAHELRNPLTPIRGAVHILRSVGPEEPRAEKARDMIERQVAHMTRLVDDLLDVSRIARGKISLRYEVLDLSRLARLAAEDYEPAVESAGLTLTAEVPADPLWVRGDPTRLSQAIGNLLHNAAKFTSPGGHITLRLTAEDGGGRALLQVRDTGIGMAPEVLKRVFEPFSQADDSLDRGRGGLGLGLALAKGLLELHGGSAEAASEGLGKGSEIRLWLPLTAAPPQPPETLHEPLAPSQPRRVLLIEDNLAVAETLKLVLELEGHRLTLADNGASALEAARQFRPQVVVCDIGLPGDMDGFAVAAAIRADPALRHSYLIALSGYGKEEDRRRAHEAGFDVHLVKPVDPFVLIKLLVEGGTSG